MSLSRALRGFQPPESYRNVYNNLGPERAIRVVPEIRRAFAEEIPRYTKEPVNARVDELIVGAGVTAAAYCGLREPGKTHVVEQRPTLGGIFGVAKRPVFYLNSRNRPTTLARGSGPGTRAPLNYIPGAVVQASEIDAREYQTQDVLAYVAALNLVDKTNVTRNYPVSDIASTERGYQVFSAYGGTYFLANRVILATGLGQDDLGCLSVSFGDGVYSFTDFLQEMGNPLIDCPLDGWRRVAVIGAGDSANVVIEYLLGQGPEAGYSTAEENAVESITWIGQSCSSKELFERNSRSRYAGIGRAMLRTARLDANYKIRTRPGKALSVGPAAPGGVKVCWREPDGTLDSDLFDVAVVCTGFKPSLPQLKDMARPQVMRVDGVPVARKVPGEEIYLIGPCADLPLTDQERQNPTLSDIPSNSAAMWRYMNKTAALAGYLGG